MSPSPLDALRIVIRWDEPRASTNAAEATWGRLSLAIGDHWLWGSDDGGIHWTWIELLEWLAEAWIWLRHEEGGPTSLPFMWDAARPSQAMAKLERYLESLPVARRGELHEDALEFIERHDLARALQGAIVPSLLVLREGHGIWVAGRNLPLEPTLEELRRSAESILARLDGLEDERALAATEAWRLRDSVDGDLLISITSGMAVERLERATDPQRLELLRQECAAPLESEFLVAARMASTPTVPDEVLDELLAVISTVRRNPGTSHDLDRLSADASALLSHMPSTATAFEQGHAVAGWLRRELDVAPEHRVDPEALLTAWGVPVGSVSLSTAELDAIAVWGPRHGPAIFVNDEGRHNQSPGGRNATLAHEISHLLVDRGGGLPLAEVVGGYAPVRLEQRARAFAAELLVPRQLAGAAFVETSRPPHAVLQTLVERFGASQEVVAWQARNSDATLPAHVWSFLRSKVSRPETF